jgi:hypothetical protein
MGKTIILRFVEDDLAVTADLLEDRAPETCRIVWESLPLEGRTVHGMYSGPEVFIRADHLGPAPAENHIHRALPGDVGYWYQEGGRYAGNPNSVGEVVFIYARGAAIMGPDGQPTWVNLFATIRPDDAARFYETGRKVRLEGPRTLRIERGSS